MIASDLDEGSTRLAIDAARRECSDMTLGLTRQCLARESPLRGGAHGVSDRSLTLGPV